MTDRSVYSVRQLNNELRNLLEMSYRSIWVEGEISGLSTPASGHIYFSLKEEKSILRCAFFRNSQMRSAFLPEEGARVLVQGQISYYEARGDLQFIVSYMEEAGEGALRRAFELLKRKLDAEGLFDTEHKSGLPAIPRSIGIVTSDTGAALYDILSTLKRRYPIAGIIIYPTLVQGDSAPQEIIRAINIARQRNETGLLIIARGGGSLEDLQAFNDEQVARCIFECEIPVISGVGHEIDFTICDLVADHRAPTPTAAAELASPDVGQLKQRFCYLQDQIQRSMEKSIRDHQQALDYNSSHLVDPVQNLNNYRNEHKHLSRQIYTLTQNKMLRIRSLFHRKEDSIRAHSPTVKIQHTINMLKTLHRDTVNHTQSKISALSREAAHLRNSIHLMSPEHTLTRGYAIAQNKSNEVITSPGQVESGETLKISVAKGQFNVTADKH